MGRPRADAARNDDSPAEGSQRVLVALEERQASLRSAAARMDAGRSSDVHQARVAARRLRSLLATFRPMLEVGGSRRMRHRLREFARELSDVRESDVRRTLLVAVAQAHPAVSPPELSRLRALLSASCAEARRELRRRIAGTDWVELVETVGDESAMAALVSRRDAGLGDLLVLVDRPWHRAAKLLRREPAEAAELHALRIAFKRCRYALEAVSRLQPIHAERTLRRLRAMQDLLGGERDALQACDWIDANAEPLGRALAGRLRRRLRARERMLGADAVVRAAKVMAAHAQWRRATGPLRKGTIPGRA
jgi:CHAD domain-containing protein